MLDVCLAIREDRLVESVLVVDGVWRVAVTTHHQRREVDHVVPSFADAVQMALPVARVLAHELGQNRYTRNSVEWHAALLDMQGRRDIDVEGLSASRLWRLDLAGGEGRKRCVGAVKGEGARIVDWHIDLDHVIEARLESVEVSVCQSLERMSQLGLLELPKALSIELVVLVGYVDPQTAFASDGARAIDLESDAVGREGRRWHVDVGRVTRQIRRAIVLQRQEVDGVVVHLLWRHLVGGHTSDGEGRMVV